MVIAEFHQQVPVRLDPENLKKALAALMHHHIGATTLPLHIEAPKELVDAHHNLYRAGDTIGVYIRIHDDGHITAEYEQPGL